jgi:hypothetical protein
MANGTGAIPPGTTMAQGAAWWSPSGHAVLIMQGDGNLVLYNVQSNPWKPLFWSGTNGHPGACARFQTDGNLVVYPPGCPTNNALWDSGTWNNSNSGPIAYVQDVGLGAMSIYQSSNGQLLWNTYGFRSTWHDACNIVNGLIPPVISRTPYPVYDNYFADCLISHDWYDGHSAGVISESRYCSLAFSVAFACNNGTETKSNYWETWPQGWSGPGNDSVDWMNSRVTASWSMSYYIGGTGSISYCNYARIHQYPNGTWKPDVSSHWVNGDSTCSS